METLSFEQAIEFYLGGDAPDLILDPLRSRYILPGTPQTEWWFQTNYPGVLRYDMKHALQSKSPRHPLTLHVPALIPRITESVSLCQTSPGSPRWGQNNFYLVYPEYATAFPNITIDTPTGIDDTPLTARILSLPQHADLFLERSIGRDNGKIILPENRIITSPGNFDVFPHETTRISILLGGRAIRLPLLEIRFGEVWKMKKNQQIDESELTPHVLSLTVHPNAITPHLSLTE